MPEREFELYLSLLSRFLRLKPAQHDEIADELRDHLEQRLEELAARGLSRDEAIRMALEEFGDAAELANHFKNVTRLRKRKLIMRYTYGTAAALATAVLIATGFWPQSPHSPLPSQGVAQEGSGGALAGDESDELFPVVAEATGGAVVRADNAKAQVEAKLAKPMGKVDFNETPMKDVLEFISDATELDILFEKAQANDAGISVDQPVTLIVRRTTLTAKATLDLILEPMQLCYTIRDGLVMVGTIAANNEIEVYNVRDLVPENGGAAMAGAQGGMGGGGGGGFFAVDSLVPVIVAAQLAQGFGGGGAGAAAPMASGMGGAAMGAHPHAASSLAALIATTIDPESWSDAGGHGSIMEYNGMLVVKNSQPVHAKVKKLLEMMRESIRENPPVGPAAAINGGS
ncbi:MAG: hypothetical protein EXS05_00090 [Planctomycetaceae bacterium]|nr:hypothetical protein [Planctomycetaceae bacterium]